MMKRTLVLGLAVMLLTGAAFMQNPMYQAYYFVAAGGNDPDITLERGESSGGAPELVVKLTTSDTEYFRFGASGMAYSSGTQTVPGEYTESICTGPLATGSVDTMGSIATRSYTVADIDAVWATAESAGTVGIMPERLQGTEAVGSGDDLLTAAFDGTATANTVVSGTLTATAANLTLAAGDRIGLDFTDDVPGELLNVCVSIRLVPAD